MSSPRHITTKKSAMKILIKTIAILLLVTASADATAQQKKQNHKKGRPVAVHKDKHVKHNVKHVHAYHKHIHHTPHYRYSSLPRRGTIVNTIHNNSIIFNHAGISFHYHAGIWYKPQGSQWVIVRPTNGIRIKTLPVGYRKVVLGPKVYYYYYGTYYLQKNNEYEVVDAPLNAAIDSLPDGYHTVIVDGKEYYELDGVYYMPSIDSTGEEILIVVANPIN